MLPEGRQNSTRPLVRIRRGLATAGLAAAIALVAGSSAEASTESFRPVDTSKHALVFNLRGLDSGAVVDAEAVLRGKRGRAQGFDRTVSVRRIRTAVSQQRRLRLRKPGFIRTGRLSIGMGSGDPSSSSSAGCTPDPLSLSAPGCRLDFEDTGSGDAASIWGSIDCESASQAQTLSGGDPEQTALGKAQTSNDFRRMTAYDGDDFWGERCELGHNDNRTGPTAVYHEGDHKLTFASIRLPSNLPLATDQWQVVLQMKQAQPAAAATGTPILALRASNGRWGLMQSNSNELSSDSHEIWSAPASAEQWTRFAFDVNFSQDPSKGSVTVYADLNGDGDAADAGEQGAKIDTYTLKREIAGGADDGIDPGESIPSHLRAGIYHSPEIDCPDGCSVDIDNVQVLNVD